MLYRLSLRAWMTRVFAPALFLVNWCSCRLVRVREVLCVFRTPATLQGLVGSTEEVRRPFPVLYTLNQLGRPRIAYVGEVEAAIAARHPLRDIRGLLNFNLSSVFRYPVRNPLCFAVFLLCWNVVAYLE